jgi:hypothetical protein
VAHTSGYKKGESKMKSRVRFLFATLSFGLALVFVAYAYNSKTLTGYRSKEPTGPIVSFEDYSKMDKKRDRSAAFAKESPHNKSVLWRQHLAYYEAKLELNKQQRDFLRRVSDFLDESFFAAPINMSEAEYLKSARGKPFKELMQNVSKLFTPEQSRQLFLTLGDISTITDWGCRAPKVTVNDPNDAGTHGPSYSEPNNSNVFGQCTCTGSICGSGCDSSSTCKVGVGQDICTAGGSCGCFGWFDCTGLCFQDGEIQ